MPEHVELSKGEFLIGFQNSVNTNGNDDNDTNKKNPRHGTILKKITTEQRNHALFLIHTDTSDIPYARHVSHTLCLQPLTEISTSNIMQKDGILTGNTSYKQCNRTNCNTT